MKKIRRLQTQGEGPRMLALEPQMNLTHGLTPKRLRGILELADQGTSLNSICCSRIWKTAASISRRKWASASGRC